MADSILKSNYDSNKPVEEMSDSELTQWAELQTQNARNLACQLRGHVWGDYWSIVDNSGKAHQECSRCHCSTMRPAIWVDDSGRELPHGTLTEDGLVVTNIGPIASGYAYVFEEYLERAESFGWIAEEPETVEHYSRVRRVRRGVRKADGGKRPPRRGLNPRHAHRSNSR